nr:DNA-formamidopyrimidine glycosylase [Petrachloros mirabilis]
MPEVETVRRGLAQACLGVTCLGGEVLDRRGLASPQSEAAFLHGLRGQTFVDWQRRGKYLLGRLAMMASTSRTGEGHEPGGWLGVHLRMTGQLLWLEANAPLQKHTRVRLFFEGQRELRFVDQRTFGKLWWVSPDQTPEGVISGLQHLGPEPLSPQFSASYLQERLRDRKRPIKSALLDQALVAGLGNIYTDEALFLSGLHPATPGSELTFSQLQRLQSAIVQVLETSLREGGTTFSDFRNLSGVNGNYGGVAWVYRRGGQPCRVCNTVILRLKLAGRSSHFCPYCQPLTSHLNPEAKNNFAI